mgnify:CR=1 FL=1
MTRSETSGARTSGAASSSTARAGAPELSGLGWILDEHLLRLPHTLHALLLSADGMVAAASKDVPRDMAERMAATASGLQSLSRQGAEFANCEDSPWELTMIKFGEGYLHLMAAGTGTYLVVSTTDQADVEAVSYAMEKAVDRLGQEMALSVRNTAGSAS